MRPTAIDLLGQHLRHHLHGLATSLQERDLAGPELSDSLLQAMRLEERAYEAETELTLLEARLDRRFDLLDLAHGLLDPGAVGGALLGPTHRGFDGDAFRWELAGAVRIGPGVETVVRIHDLRGRCVRELRTIADGPGPVAIRWDGCDASGRSLPSGAYLARAASAGGTATAFDCAAHGHESPRLQDISVTQDIQLTAPGHGIRGA